MNFEILGIIISTIGAIASVWFIIERGLPLRHYSWRHVQRAAAKMVVQMRKDGFDPTLIVGIGRGGAIMSSIISGCMGHRPILVIDRKYTWIAGRRTDDLYFHVHLPFQLLEKVLLVAGEAHSGNTMRLYYHYLSRIGAKEVKKAVFLFQKGCTESVEYMGVSSSRDLRMPWMFAKEYSRQDRSKEETYAVGHIVIGTTNATKTYYIIRHGKSSDNEQGDRYSGISESQLTETGIRQAECIGRALQQMGIQRIVASPMVRTITTARRIQELINAPLVSDPRLREMDFGEWEGMSRKDVHLKWPELYDQYKADPVQYNAPGGESPKSVLARVIELFHDLESSPSYQDVSTIALVTHNTIAKIMLCYLSGMSLQKYRERRVDNASITKVIFDINGGHVIIYENDISHLDEFVDVQ